MENQITVGEHAIVGFWHQSPCGRKMQCYKQFRVEKPVFFSSIRRFDTENLNVDDMEGDENFLQVGAQGQVFFLSRNAAGNVIYTEIDMDKAMTRDKVLEADEMVDRETFRFPYTSVVEFTGDVDTFL